MLLQEKCCKVLTYPVYLVRVYARPHVHCACLHSDLEERCTTYLNMSTEILGRCVASRHLEEVHVRRTLGFSARCDAGVLRFHAILSILRVEMRG